MKEQCLPDMKETRSVPLWIRGFKEFRNDIRGDDTNVEVILHPHPLKMGGAR